MSAIELGGLRNKIAVGAAIFGSMLAALPALAGVGGSVIPSFPTPIKVGDLKTATVTITNRATAPNNTEKVNVSAIFVTPSCKGSDGFTCQVFDRNVFQFGPTATGKVGTSCANATFQIGTPNPATGEFELIPAVALELGPANGSGPLPKQCVININFSVQKAPLDSSEPNPPLTTDSLAHANLQGATSGALGSASGGSQSAIAAVADLFIGKTDGQTTVLPGSAQVYTVTVTNSGPSEVTGAVVVDTAPGGVTFGNWSCAVTDAGTSIGPVVTACGAANGVGNLSTTANLKVGGVVTYTINATVTANSGTITNTASVTPPTGTINAGTSCVNSGVITRNFANPTCSSTDVSNVQPTSALTVTKDDGTPTYVPGGQVVYTIVVGNTGPSDAIGAVVTDSKPSQVTTWTWVCSGSTGNPLPSGCDGGSSAPFSDTVTLPAGSTLTYTVTALIGAGATGDMVNTVTATPPVGTGSPVSATDTDTAAPSSTLTVSKNDGTPTYVPGGQVVYTIVVGNTGPSNAVNAVVTDSKPSQVTTWTWVCSGSTGNPLPSGCDGGSSAPFSDTVTLPAGSTLTYTVTALIGAGATGDMVNTVTATPPVGTGSPVSATDTDTAAPSSTLTVSKNDGTPTYVPGGQVVYTIVVGNTGPSNAVNAVVTDSKPSQVTTWTWVCSGSTGNPLPSGCDGGSSAPFSDTVTLPAGSTLTYTVTALIGAGATGDMVNTVTATPPVGTGSPVSATDTDTAAPVSNLSVTKSDGVASYTPGAQLIYTIVVGNNGPSNATAVTVSDNKPSQIANWTWACVHAGGATGCSAAASSANNFLDTGISLPVGSTITYTVTANITNPTTGDIVNTATATPTGGTPVSATDTDTLGGPGVFHGHFDYDLYYFTGAVGTNTYTRAQHVHRYDDVYDKTGVNHLHPSEDLFRLTRAAITNAATTFKILVMNQYLNPAVKLAIGPAVVVEESVKTYGNLASQTDATLLLAGLSTYTTANIGNFVLNMPTNAFAAFDWWGDGQPARSGLIPTVYSCVWDPDTDGTTDTPGPNGERSNGALTIQIIRSNTPASAIEPNVAGAGNIKYGWRVKQADFKTYVIAEYTGYWHHPNDICYGEPGWTQTPAEDNTTANAVAPAAGADDPSGPWTP